VAAGAAAAAAVAPAAAVAAANSNPSVMPIQDGSDDVVMESGAEEASCPAGGVAPAHSGAAAAATGAASMMEAKEDEPVDQSNRISAAAIAAAAAAATGAAAANDSSHVVRAQGGAVGRMDIGVEVGNRARGAAPNGQGAGAAAAGAAAAVDRGGERIFSLSLQNDPELAVGNRHRRAVVPPRRVTPKRKAKEIRSDDDPEEPEEWEEPEEPEQQEEQKEEENEEERKSAAGDDAADEQSTHHWTRFKKVTKKTVHVQWANGEDTIEPRAAFEPQIDPFQFAYHASMAEMPPKQQREMLARVANSRSNAAASECKPRATRSGHLFSGLSHPKSKKARCDAKKESGENGVDSNQATMPARVALSHTTCSYCGCAGIPCFHCTAVASCSQRVCMQCWTLATHAASAEKTVTSSGSSLDRVRTAAVPDRFHCQQHNGSVHVSTHPTVQLYGLPSAQPQSIGVWTSKFSFPAYHSQLHTSSLSPVLLSAAGLLSLGQQSAAAVLLDYHSDVDHGHASFDEPAVGRRAEPDIRQVALLARFVDPATTKLVVLLTCGPYRKQLEEIRAASRELYPHTAFLLFDIAQLFVKDILPAVCGTVRQYLQYPSASPLHLAAENFGKRLLQTYRPSFLFRGQLLPVLHHIQDALTKCACGVTLKSHGLAHKAAGWEAFERFQVYRYKCKKVPNCSAMMLVPRL